MGSGPRAPRILVVLATVALVGAILTGYARRAVFDADQFATRATTGPPGPPSPPCAG